MLLGSERLMIQVVERAHLGGADVIAIDNNPVSPAKKLADESYLVSTHDVDEVVQLIKDKNIDGVISGYSDSLLPYYYEICNKAGVPCYIDNPRQLQFVTDKDLFKTRCREYDVPTVQQYTNIDDVRNYPVIVKPVDNSGARGITVCRNKQQLVNGVSEALKFSAKKRVLIEDYLEWKEATLFYLCLSGEVYLSCAADRHIWGCDEKTIRLPTGYTFPSDITRLFLEHQDQSIRNVLQGVGLSNGWIFIQALVSSEGQVIPYEMGFRLTGSLEHTLIEHACGYNPMDMLINHALTGDMGGEALKQKVNPYFPRTEYNISCLMRPGVISEIRGLDEIRGLSGVLDVFPSYEPGDELRETQRGQLAQIAIRVLLAPDSEKSLDNIYIKMDEELQVISPTGENLLLNTRIMES